jgi:Trp operon repressor
MHKILKMLFRSNHYRYEDSMPEPTAKAWRQLHDILEIHLQGDSHKVVWKFLKYTSEFVEKATTVHIVRSAFRLSGTVCMSS